MAMAISCGVVSLLPYKVCKPTSVLSSPKFSDESVGLKPMSRNGVGWEDSQKERMILIPKMGSLSKVTPGTALLDRPNASQSEPMPQPDDGVVGGQSCKNFRGWRGHPYRVLLVYDETHTEALVENVLPQIFANVSAAFARKLFNESREKGSAVVTVVTKTDAENYASKMIRSGLHATIEPDSEEPEGLDDPPTEIAKWECVSKQSNVPALSPVTIDPLSPKFTWDM